MYSTGNNWSFSDLRRKAAIYKTSLEAINKSLPGRSFIQNSLFRSAAAGYISDSALFI